MKFESFQEIGEARRKMKDDYKVPPRSAKQIEVAAIAWREAFDVNDQWAPDVVELMEIWLPRSIPQFALVVRPDNEMEDAEAYTEFNPPHIAVRSSVYHRARKFDGRSRMTFAHELGHLVMHASDGPRPRAVISIKRISDAKIFESAEWQARKFASLFLMPEQIVRQFESARSLAEACKVSLQAAEIRFNELNLNNRPTPECIQDLANALTKKVSFPKPKLIT